jgi:hypothetical protein
MEDWRGSIFESHRSRREDSRRAISYKVINGIIGGQMKSSERWLLFQYLPESNLQDRFT